MASALMRGLNCMGGEKETTAGFVEYVHGEHRTLQQAFGRLVAAWIIATAKQPYDLRNEGVVKMCQKLAPIVEESYLPYV